MTVPDGATNPPRAFEIVTTGVNPGAGVRPSEARNMRNGIAAATDLG